MEQWIRYTDMDTRGLVAGPSFTTTRAPPSFLFLTLPLQDFSFGTYQTDEIL